MVEDMATQKVNVITKHILHHLGRHKAKLPMIVGLQGPQGSGKTTVTQGVQNNLEREGKRTAVLSIDDFYLTHAKLEELKQLYPENRLLHGRGQPGTHDMHLGTRILSQLKESSDGTTIHLPIFDKSKFNGEGDRVDKTVDVITPIDVVIFEGWCMGFYPIPADALEELFQAAKNGRATGSGGKAPFFAQHSLESLQQINTILAGYLDWYRLIDAFIILRPQNLLDVFTWRLQAEHAMKEQGKSGMTDDQVHDFVARYMPGYEIFGDGPRRDDAPWAGKGLVMDIDKERNLINTDTF